MKQDSLPPVLWFTGLPCSGKTTLAKEVSQAFIEKGCAVEILDGDSIRKFFPELGFTQKDRESHLQYMGFLAQRLQAHGVAVIASFVSPYRSSRDHVRKICQNFVEIYVSTPLVECELRDVKGMYAKARRGEIAHFTGINDPYEAPLTPEIQVDTSAADPSESAKKILERLQILGAISSEA